MTDTELKTLVTAIITAALLMADKTYVHGSDWRPHETRDERLDNLSRFAAEIVNQVLEEGIHS